MLLTNFGVDLNKSVIGFVLRSIESVSACFPCHGKTRVNGGRQKAKTAGVLMNLSRLRQLGPQQFTKKTEEGWQDKPFLIIYIHHDIISPASTFSHVVYTGF